jgi:hypothetical protein
MKPLDLAQAAIQVWGLFTISLSEFTMSAHYRATSALVLYNNRNQRAGFFPPCPQVERFIHSFTRIIPQPTKASTPDRGRSWRVIVALDRRGLS